eukprot:333679_1
MAAQAFVASIIPGEHDEMDIGYGHEINSIGNEENEGVPLLNPREYRCCGCFHFEQCYKIPCCNCSIMCCKCCRCCLAKAASYNDGLYPIDVKMYSISFILFTLLALYSEIAIQGTYESIYAVYTSTSGIIFMLFGSICSQIACCNFMSSPAHIFGGILYIIAYCMYSVEKECIDQDWWWWDSDTWWWNNYKPPCMLDPQLFIGRGLFVGIHSIYFGVQYCKKKICDSRAKLIRFWSILFILYAGLVLPFLCGGTFCYYWVFGFLVASPGPFGVVLLLLIVMCMTCCCGRTTHGCNCYAVIGFILWYTSLANAISLMIVASWSQNALLYWSWDISLCIFSFIQLWILTRAMNPIITKCGCNNQMNGVELVVNG